MPYVMKKGAYQIHEMFTHCLIGFFPLQNVSVVRSAVTLRSVNIHNAHTNR